MTDFYYFHDQLWCWRYSGLSFTVLMFPGSFQEQEKGNWKYWCHHICAQSVINISHFQILICVYFSSFSFTPASEKRWNKPARLASFRLLCPCQEKMCTYVALMPAREAGADEGLWECGQNSERWWQSAADANAELANLQRITPEREPIK